MDETSISVLVTEGYPSGLRGRFAKSLVWGNLEQEFESLLLRQDKNTTMNGRIFILLGRQRFGFLPFALMVQKARVSLTRKRVRSSVCLKRKCPHFMRSLSFLHYTTPAKRSETKMCLHIFVSKRRRPLGRYLFFFPPISMLFPFYFAHAIITS